MSTKKWDLLSTEEKAQYMQDYINTSITLITKNIYAESIKNKEDISVADIKFINIVTGLLVRAVNIFSNEEEDIEMVETIIEIINKNIPDAINGKAILAYVAKVNKISKLTRNRSKEIVN